MPTALPRSFTISELAAETRIPVPRIKFYLREGLLPEADLGARKRAFYDDRHAQRLRLIHALRQLADLGVPAIRTLCALIDGRGQSDLAAIVAHVIDALGASKQKAGAFPARETASARREVLAVLAAHDIRVRPQACALTDLANALLGLRQVLGAEVSAQAFVPYLEAMCRLAERDFKANAHLLTDASSAGLAATLGTVLWEPVLLILRRIAHEHVAGQMLPGRARAPTRRRRVP